MAEDKLADTEVALHEFHDNAHRNEGHHTGLEGHGRSPVVLFGKPRAVSEDTDGLDDAHDLVAAADAVLVYLYLALNEKHHLAWAVKFVVDDLILTELFHGNFLIK